MWRGWLSLFAFSSAEDAVLTSMKVGETGVLSQPISRFATKTETFRTSAIPLAPGGVVFTKKDRTVIEFPQPLSNTYAITGFTAEMVDDDGQSVPLNELYLHHWLVYRTGHPNMGVCGDPLNYVFGVGAESRSSPVVFPEGYGYLANKGDRWTLNVHALRTVGLKKLGFPPTQAQAVKECIECNYAIEKTTSECTPLTSGSFSCCKNGMHCPTDGSITGKKNYYFQYKVTYTTQVSQVLPLHFYLLDASNCQVEHNIQANNRNPVHVTQHSWKNPANSKLVFAVGHIHVGGINVTLFVNGQELCTTIAEYGTDPANTPGNEKGYLIKNDGCPLDMDGKAGDIITVRSHYWVGTESDPLKTVVPPGGHNGVMDYMYLGIVADSLTFANGTAVDLFRSDEIVFEPAEHPENLRQILL